jgi:hypothetical protein
MLIAHYTFNSYILLEKIIANLNKYCASSIAIVFSKYGPNYFGVETAKWPNAQIAATFSSK